jgi:RHS repeat-associated protein
MSSSSGSYTTGPAVPCPDCPTCNQDTGKPIRYVDGAVRLRESDLSIPSGGLFGHTRVYGNQPATTYSGLNGFNWWVSEIPAAYSVGASTVAITFDSNFTYWFDKVGSSYVPRYSFLNISLVEDTVAKTFTFADTSNAKTVVTVFNSLAAATNPGMFVSHTDSRGVQTTIVSQTGTQINELQRSYTVGGVVTVESLAYSYFSSGSALGYLQSVLYRKQVGGGSWTPIEQALYGYWGASSANGSLNDLQSATRQLPNGTGWVTVAVDFYRYWLAGSSTGFAHGLKMRFGPEACRLMFNAGINPATAADATVLPYVDQYFEYDPTTWSVTKEISAVCASCPGGGTTSDLFTYASNPHYPGDGYGTWKTKTTQTLPDGSKIVFYGNYAALPILKVTIDPTGANMWATFYRYTSAGVVTWEAQPSAVALPASLSTLEAYNDLLNYNPSTGLYQYLNSTGLIKVTTYDAEGNPLTRGVQQGQSGTPIPVSATTYTTNTDSVGNTIYPVAAETIYPVAGSTATAYTTSWAYLFYAGTNQISTKTKTLPVVTTAQNGSGVADTTVEQLDTYGNRTQYTDERGIVDTYVTDPVLSRVVTQVLNYQSGVTAPGVNVATNFSFDDFGRPLTSLGNFHTVVIAGTAVSVQPVTSRAYNQTAQPGSGAWAPDQNTSARGYFDGTNYTLIDPVTVTSVDKDGRIIDRITSHRTSGSGGLLSPTETFAQTDWQTWSSTQYNEQHQTISDRTYFLIPASGLGTFAVNYGETDFGYDALERRNRVCVWASAIAATITRTVWTTPQWVASVWVGTNDNGATDSDPTGGGAPGNNMVMVSSNQWDGGSAGGDGNRTQETKYVSATPGDTRVTNWGYDFRDRKVTMTDATGRFTLWGTDNLGRRTLAQQFASVTGNLIAQGGAGFDARGRQYQTLRYAVDPSTGAVGYVLTGNTWYDPSGNTVQQIAPGAGQVFTKSQYNGVDWVTATYTGYNTSGVSYAQAQSVSGDIVIEQAQSTLDEVGTTVNVATFQRLNDASTTAAGALTPGNARITYTAAWSDGIDRQIAFANYGAASSFTRPNTPPSSSSTVLVNGTAYDRAGRVYQTTDPKSIVNQSGYDNASRTTQTIEDVGGLARTTNYTWTLNNQKATMTAVNAVTGDQTTAWLYGTTLANSGIARNDLLSQTAYPDALGWSTLAVGQWANLGVNDWGALPLDPTGDVTSLTYNRLGEKQTFTDQRGVVRTVLNQVALTYNTFAQLTLEQQEHSGAVTGSTPSVGYAYDSGASGSNEIRLNQLTYPNGRVISYNTATGMDATLNRVTSISDTSAALASYAYLGLGSVVRITYPQPGVWLDLWGGTSGVFAGLDLFNRVIDQRWQNNITTTPTDIDRYQYGYDLNSNREYKANVVGTANVAAGLDEFYTNDNLNRLTDMQRGVLNSTNTGITGTPAREMAYGLDPTGNWSTYATQTSGTTDLNQGRTANPINEITNIAASGGTPAWVTPAYDAAGNMTTMPQPGTPTSSFAAVYDAWMRMTAIDAGASPVGQYQYDGRNRRTISVTTATRHFYFTNSWRDIEQRVGTAATADQQHVWGVRSIDDLVCRDDATPERLYSCQDLTFNVTVMTDIASSVRQRFLYDPYGEGIVLSGSWAPTTDAHAWMHRFTGQQCDPETLIYLYRTRYYHPPLGAFAGRDSAIYYGGTSFYSYVSSAPIAYVDPWGLRPVDTALDPTTSKRYPKDCTVILTVSHDYTTQITPFEPNPNCALSAVGQLSCYADYANYAGKEQCGISPAPGRIQSFPSIKASIGPGPFDASLDWRTSKNFGNPVFNRDLGGMMGLSDAQSDYNGGYGAGIAGFAALLKKAWESAEEQAEIFSHECDKCCCHEIIVAVECWQQPDWVNAAIPLFCERRESYWCRKG